MIDLNHLLNNVDLYNEKYANKGLKTRVDFFVDLENKRKELQQKTEKMRALCNKLCGEVPAFRDSGKNTAELLEKIVLLDNQIKFNNKILNKQTKIINKKLKKLHNLPDFANPFHEQMTTIQAGSHINQLHEFVSNNYKVIVYQDKICNYFKKNKNKLLEEKNMPMVLKCSDGYLFLCKSDDVQIIQEQFLKYFQENALSLIKVSCRKLHWANNASFYVHLNHKRAFYFEINKEYCSREYNIKYRDSKTDMTKFANQLNILFRW